MPQAIFDDPEGVHAMLRDSVAALAERRPGPVSLRTKRSNGMDTDGGMWSALAEAGWTGLLLPEDLGGTGLGPAEQAVLSEALGRALICEPVAMGAVFASTILCDAPASAARDSLASGIAGGQAMVAPAWRGREGRSGKGGVKAQPVDGGYAITGEAHYVDQASSARDFLVLAYTDRGAAFFSVPASMSGITLETSMGVDGASIGSLRFDGCMIPNEAVVAEAASESILLERPIINARIALSAELAGLAARAVELTIEFSKARIQFGGPIASFQAIRHRLVDMWSDAELACASVVNAVEMLKSGDERAGRMAVLAAKARTGDAAVSICRRAVHLHGAMGFTDECDIGLYLKRAISLNATLGQPEALRIEFVKLERAA